jgi:hypothetical protein
MKPVTLQQWAAISAQAYGEPCARFVRARSGNIFTEALVWDDGHDARVVAVLIEDLNAQGVAVRQRPMIAALEDWPEMSKWMLFDALDTRTQAQRDVANWAQDMREGGAWDGE